MKKSYIKIFLYCILSLLILFINSFVLNILTYYKMIILLLCLLIIFKLLNGFEKDRHRYYKDIIMNILIIILTFFIIYYLFGLIIGFVRTPNYYNYNSFKKLILPYLIIVCLKEYLRYQLLNKSKDIKILSIIILILFIMFDITNDINIKLLDTGYKKFIFISTILLPSISKNIVANYITKNVGYKPNILWIIIFELYSSLIPIVPNTGIYISSIISFVFPLIIFYNVYNFFEKRKKRIPLSNDNNLNFISLYSCMLFIGTLIYFTSGYFKYYIIAIGSGSMIPNIYKGDAVILNQKYDINKLEVGDIIAYEYEKKIIVHRLNKIDKFNNERYFYTKGDANNAIDNYIIYESMIKGKVEFKIPYIGYPTVWLSEL